MVAPVIGKKRNPWMVILLGIVTLGVYWLILLLKRNRRRKTSSVSVSDPFATRPSGGPGGPDVSDAPESAGTSAHDAALEAEIERDLALTQLTERQESSSDLVVQKATGITDTPPMKDEEEDAPTAKPAKPRKPKEEEIEVVVPKKWTEAPAAPPKPKAGSAPREPARRTSPAKASTSTRSKKKR